MVLPIGSCKRTNSENGLSRKQIFESRLFLLKHQFVGNMLFFPTTKMISYDIHPCPLKKDYLNRKYIFQPLMFRGHSLVFGGIVYSDISID